MRAIFKVQKWSAGGDQLARRDRHQIKASIGDVAMMEAI